MDLTISSEGCIIYSEFLGCLAFQVRSKTKTNSSSIISQGTKHDTPNDHMVVNSV